MASVILSSGSDCLRDGLHRLLEFVNLAEGVLVDLGGLLGAEHLGSGIKGTSNTDAGDSHTGSVAGHDVVAVEDSRTAATVDRVAEERESDCGTHDTAVVSTGQTGLMLEQVVEVEQDRGNSLGEPSGTTVDHGGGHGSGTGIGVPHHRVLCLVEDIPALALLSGLDDLVFDCTLDKALDYGSDGSGLAVCLDDVVDHVIGIQALESVGEKLGTLERPDGHSHLELSGLFECGRESTGLHGIPMR